MSVAELLTVAHLVTNRDAAVALVNNTEKTHTVTVPAGKRWFLQGGLVTNGDDVDRNLTISVTDGTNVMYYIRASSNLVAAQACAYPTMQSLATNTQFPGKGMILDPGWTVTFYWAAGGASTGGNSTVTAVVLEVDV